MIAQLRAKPGGDEIAVTLGNFAVVSHTGTRHEASAQMAYALRKAGV